MTRTTMIAVMLLFPLAHAEATTRFVSPGQSIQQQIDLSQAGDEVVVLPGTYNETIDLLGLAITVRSSAGAESTILDGSRLESSVVTMTSGEGPDTTLRGFTITGGIGTITGGYRLGGGVLIINGSPVIDQCVITGNSAYAGGGIQSKVAWPTITNCRLENNTASGLGDFGGAGLHVSLGGPVVRNSSFLNNSAVSGANGGGIGMVGGDTQLVNCLIKGNDAYTGGGIRNNNGRPVITNCTVVGNTAVNAGGGLRSIITSSAVSVVNSIFWGNDAPFSPQIDEQGWSLTYVEHCNVEGGWNGSGKFNLGVDPQFIDQDYRLSSESPCVDAGENVVIVATDLDGNDRLVGTSVDIGAYEVQDFVPPCVADFDDNGNVAFADLNALLTAWGLCPPGGAACPEDITNDGIVGFNDLNVMLQLWGSCP